jgi:hypothetical protein
MSVTAYLEPPELPWFVGAGFFAGTGAAFAGAAGAAGVGTTTAGVVTFVFFFLMLVAVGVGAAIVDDVSVVADPAAFASAVAS